MDIGDGTDELGEDLLDFIDRQRTMAKNVVVQFIPRAVFEHQPNQLLRHDDFVQASDMRMKELAMVVDFAGEVRVFPTRRLEDDLTKDD